MQCNAMQKRREEKSSVYVGDNSLIRFDCDTVAIAIVIAITITIVIAVRYDTIRCR